MAEVNRESVLMLLQAHLDRWKYRSPFGRAEDSLKVDQLPSELLPKLDLEKEVPSYLDSLQSWNPPIHEISTGNPPGPENRNMLCWMVEIRYLSDHDRSGTVAHRDVRVECEKALRGMKYWMSLSSAIARRGSSFTNDVLRVWGHDRDETIAVAKDVAQTLAAWKISPPNKIVNTLIFRDAARKRYFHHFDQAKERWVRSWETQ